MQTTSIKNSDLDYDFVIIGSGFGGSVSALRLSEKGYKVLVIEKGKWYRAEDFPKTNWNLRRWLWLPFFRFFGFFKITFFRHVGVVSGVGVGGGSLVYANTLPVPKSEFFNSGSWKNLRDWEKELKQFYEIAKKMLGVTKYPRIETGDVALRQLAKEIGRTEDFKQAEVAVFFGEPNRTVPDPFFDGKGPDRAGCNFCGGCMTGCRFNAKNTLDKNYLHLAQLNGAKILAETEVFDVRPLDKNRGETGYALYTKSSTKLWKSKRCITAKSVVFAGGVLGTISLLLKLKKSSLPHLSDKIGADIRTNNESLLGVTSIKKDKIFSDGIAITSILQTDSDSHLEPVRYGAGSGFWRFGMMPLALGKNVFVRVGKIIVDWLRHPIENLKCYLTDDWAKRTQILLFMQHLDSTLQFKKDIFGMKSKTVSGANPTAFIPRAEVLARHFSKIVGGKPYAFLTEPLLGIPMTAHILGGAVIGASPDEGVIDTDNKIFNYENLWICDGSVISANPGVNPSLTITAISERAMSLIPPKQNSQ